MLPVYCRYVSIILTYGDDMLHYFVDILSDIWYLKIGSNFYT